MCIELTVNFDVISTFITCNSSNYHMEMSPIKVDMKCENEVFPISMMIVCVAKTTATALRHVLSDFPLSVLLAARLVCLNV